ncbi:MAG: TlyA family RNA methyltransferase [Lentisphaerota bacterium]
MKKKTKSQRLDQLLVGRGLAESREKAQRLIRAALVQIDGQIRSKPGHEFPEDADIVLLQTERFVSRGGEKLEEAFRQFALDVTGKICMDVGASTGGFTDCLLQHGAARVYAIDVGKRQLHWKLSKDSRVIIMDECNARYLKASDIPDHPSVATVDASFISLTKILPAVVKVLEKGGQLVSLIKPQFEAGREQVQKGGVVKDPAIHENVIVSVRQFVENELGLKFLGLCTSPVKGPAGNVEFLAYWGKQ